MPQRALTYAFALLVVLAAAAHPPSALAQQSPNAPVPVRREILALFDSRNEPTPTDTRVHKLAELPLNHIGYIVRYHDLRLPLPPLEQALRYAAVLTWFGEPVEQPQSYLSWAADVANHGQRFILMGETGGRSWTSDLPWINRFLRPLGLRHEGVSIDNTVGAAILTKNPGFMEFERPLDPILPPFPLVAAASARVEPLLTAALPAFAGGGQHSVLAAITAQGGYVAGEYILHFDPDADRVIWLLNPFAFFRAVLGAAIFPIPDVTTISGRRLYFSHVDGDGLNNIALFSPYLERSTLAPEVLLTELIEPYPDLPMSFGLVAGDVDSKHFPGSVAGDVVKRIFALPWVEVASHSYTHPFNWPLYEHYSRERELLGSHRHETARRTDGDTAGLVSRLVERIHSQAAGNIAGSASEAPRAFANLPFDLTYETKGALDASTLFAPPGKTAKLYQWSGDARPFEAAIAATRAAGARNINGGDTRLDARHPSVKYVAPISRVVGAERQIYAVNSNENTYTNEWHGPYWGFRNLTETLERTDRPRRLKGVNIYYHAFSAERKEGLEAVKAMLDVARSMPLAPITASHYAGIADSFFEVEIAAIGPRRWRISQRGELQTVRFDAAESMTVDLAASRGVIGSNRHQGALYVALDRAVEDAVVALADHGPAAQASAVAMIQSRWRVWGLERQACGFSFTAQGFGVGEFEWENAQPGPFSIKVSRHGAELPWPDAIVSSRNVPNSGPGEKLNFTIAQSAIEPLEIAVLCARPGGSGTEVLSGSVDPEKRQQK